MAGGVKGGRRPGWGQGQEGVLSGQGGRWRPCPGLIRPPPDWWWAGTLPGPGGVVGGGTPISIGLVDCSPLGDVLRKPKTS